MEPFRTLTSTAAPLLDQGRLMSNVDTDMIIPKQFLKTTSREGLKTGLFHELKTLENGAPNPDFVLNQPQYQSVGILIAGENFGCGSSREHAAWALLDQGIRCVIAPSFADIFYNNCLQNGILALALPREICDDLSALSGGKNCLFTVDLAAKTLTAPDGQVHSFEIDPKNQQKLLQGLDDIALSLLEEAKISAFETQRAAAMPWLSVAAE